MNRVSKSRRYRAERQSIYRRHDRHQRPPTHALSLGYCGDREAAGSSRSREGCVGTHQMLSLRSLAFIRCSAIRRARALSCAALHCFPDRISGRNIARNKATKMPAKTATKLAVACIAVSYEQFTPSRLDAASVLSRAQKCNQLRFRTLPSARLP